MKKEKLLLTLYLTRGNTPFEEKTEDNVDARIIVALVNEMIIITVIRITKKKSGKKL